MIHHVGIYLHSRNMTLVAINDNGKLLTEEKLTNTPANLEQFFGKFTQPIQAVMEGTSSWYWVADWCSEKNIPLQLAHAKMLKAISYAKVFLIGICVIVMSNEVQVNEVNQT